MKEKIFKKGITRRLLSVVLTLAMVLSLLPLNATLVYAAEPVLGEKIESSAKEVSGTDFKVVSTKYENYGSYGEWVIGGVNNATITVSRTAGNTTKNIGKLVFGYVDVSHEDPSGYYWINTEYFTGCEGATVVYDEGDKLTISDLNTSSITIGFSDTNAALLPNYVEIYYVDAPAIEISNVEVDFSQIPIAVGATKTQMDAASITIKVDDVDMTDAFDITEKSLCDTMGDEKTIIESNYFLNYNYVINFAPKDGYSFASDFSKENISITTPTASNIDGTNKSYISVDNSIMASFHFNTRPTQIKATSVSEYWYNWMTESEMANITFTTNDSEHPTVCIDTQGSYTNWRDIVGGCCDDSGNLKTEYLSGPLNFQVRFGEKYYGESYTDWMNVTSAKITLFGEGYSSKLLTLEMSFTDGDKDYVLKYDAYKITYYEPKEQGSSEWKVMTEDLVIPTENSSKTNSIPNYAPSGKEFTGNWTTTANGSTPYTFGSPLTANVKLYPIWGDHTHTWGYTADDSVITATCSNTSHTATLTLTATSPNYSGIDGLEAFNEATGLDVKESSIEIYKVSTEGETSGGEKVTGIPTQKGYYYASLTVEGQTAVKAFSLSADIKPLTFTAKADGSKIAFSVGNFKNVQYKLNDGDWTDTGYKWFTLNTGDVIQYRATLEGTCTTQARFDINTGEIEASGDVTSLINGVGGDVDLSSYSGINTTNPNFTYGAFKGLFQNDSALTTAPNLPSTKLGANCYQAMFTGCSSLKEAPELPAQEVKPYCYYYMFHSCSSLVSAPELPAKTLFDSCYYCMFHSCTSLETPPELPATTLAKDCYYCMFVGDTSLTKLPTIAATTLASGCCYGMFINCTGIELKDNKEPGYEIPWLIPATTEVSGWNTNMINGATGIQPYSIRHNKVYYQKGISHKYIYSVDKTILKAECDKVHDSECDASYALTFIASDANYSGNAVTYGDATDVPAKDISITDYQNWSDAVGAPIVEFSNDNGETWSTTAPTNAGDYIVRLYPSEESENPTNVLEKEFSILINSWATLQEAINNATEPVTIKLTQDIVARETDSALNIADGKNITIDLNGHKIDRNLTTATEDGYVIKIKSNGNLTIKDTSANKTGVITGGYNLYQGGGIIVDSLGGKGSLTLESGSVCGNRSALSAAGISVEGGIFTMTGGSIKDNEITENGNDGGALYVTNNSIVKLLGGIITGNKSESDSSLWISTWADNTLGGDIRIFGNTTQGVEININDDQITGLKISTETPLVEGAMIGAWRDAENYSEDYAVVGLTEENVKYFKSDIKNYILTCVDGKLHMEKALHNWTYVTSGAALIATCDKECGEENPHTATLTLTSTSPEYSGSAVDPIITYGTSDEQTAWTDAGLVLPDSTGEGAPTVTKTYYSTDESGEKSGEGSAIAPASAGAYVVEIKISYGEGKEATVSLAYNVNKTAGAEASAEGTTVAAGQGQVTITGMKEGQEYIVSTKAEVSSLTDDDWSTPVGADGIASDLADETTYYVYTRVKETDNSNAGDAVLVDSASTNVAAPADNKTGYTVSDDKITVADGYEVFADENCTEPIVTGTTLIPGTTYYVRKAGKEGFRPSEALSFTYYNIVDPRTVTYDLNKGTGAQPAPQTVENGSLIDAPVFAEGLPVKGSLSFQGWYKDRACTEAWDFAKDQLTEDITLYAGYAYDAGVHEEKAEMSVLEVEDCIYNGKAHKPAVIVKHDGKVLTLNKDYTVKYKNNIKANPVDSEGKLITGGIDDKFKENLPTIIIKGKGNYKSEVKLNFNIIPYSLDEDDIAYNVTDYIKAKPKSATAVKVSLSAGSKKLKAGRDYVAVLVNEANPEATYTGLKVPKGESGVYSLTITGKGNYTGTLYSVITIAGAGDILEMNKAKIKMDKIAYEGKAITAEDIKSKIKSVKIGNTTLTADDYDVTLNVDSISSEGRYVVAIEGKNQDKVIGSKTIVVTVSGTAISKARVSFNAVTEFDNSKHGRNGMKVEMKSGDTTKTLAEGTDYIVKSIKNDLKAGKATVEIQGIGIYKGTKRSTYKINQRVLSDKESDGFIIAPIENQKYQKSGAMPDVDISYKGVKLTKGTDYTLSYTNNKKTGTGYVTVTGKGNFKGQIKDLAYIIEAASFEDSGVTVQAKDVVYNTKNPAKYQSVVTVYDGNKKKLTANSDYSKTVKYYSYQGEFDGDYSSSALAAHKGAELKGDSKPVAGSRIIVEVTPTERGNYTGSIYGTYRITTASISKAKIAFENQMYTGKEIELTAKDVKKAVINKTTTLEYGKDFEIVEGSYVNNIKKGTAKVTVRGLGNYGGTKVVKFKITSKNIVWWKKNLPQ